MGAFDKKSQEYGKLINSNNENSNSPPPYPQVPLDYRLLHLPHFIGIANLVCITRNLSNKISKIAVRKAPRCSGPFLGTVSCFPSKETITTGKRTESQKWKNSLWIIFLEKQKLLGEMGRERKRLLWSGCCDIYLTDFANGLKKPQLGWLKVRLHFFVL